MADVTTGGRVYIELHIIDADGNEGHLHINPPADLADLGDRVAVPYICSECCAIVIDPAGHNVAHDGPACRVCGCTDSQACVTAEGPCRWVEADLCSACQPYLQQITDAIATAKETTS